MRITAQAKRETRARLLRVGHELFLANGFEATTTREIAEAAGLATGTLFNYFGGKEALGMALLDDALLAGQTRFERTRREAAGLDEELFAHVAAELRELRPHRGYVGPVLETAFSPFGSSDLARAGAEARLRHLETVAQILLAHGHTQEGAVVAMHLYWTLYLGVLAFWSGDTSRKQEDTLAVLDQSMRLMVRAFEQQASEPEGSDRYGR